MSLQMVISGFFSLYRRRNRLCFGSLRDRIDFLNIGIGDLEHAIRQRVNRQTISLAAARVFARICCVAEHFHELPLVVMLARKYPLTGCSYCHRASCSCTPEHRNPPTLLGVPDESQLRWRLIEWCGHLNSIYGRKNELQGIEFILNRLFRELVELQSVEMSRMSLGTLDAIERKITLELADAFAWTIAIANYFKINLEAAVLKRYGKRCAACRRNPCACGHFNVEPIDWRIQAR